MLRIKSSTAEAITVSGLIGWMLLIIPAFETVEPPLVVFIVVCVVWVFVAINAGHACNKKHRLDVPTEVRSCHIAPVACVAKVYPLSDDRYDAFVFYDDDGARGDGHFVTVDDIAFDDEDSGAFIEEVCYSNIVYRYSGTSLLFEVVDDAPVSETKRVLHLSESTFREAFDA